MVLNEGNVNISLEKLEDSLPKDHLCYFIEDVVDKINCSEEDTTFVDINSDVGYPCKLILRLILMSIFDGGLSAHEIERKTNYDVVYMYLARLKTPCFKTIAKFKANFSNLIFEAFKLSIELADDEILVKICNIIKNSEKSTNLNSVELKLLKNLDESINVDNDDDTECI